MATESAMLTTVDNPYSPFTQWDEWYCYDMMKGYHTPGLLARICVLSDEMTESDRDLTIQEAIDEIVRENVSGVHRKITSDDPTLKHEDDPGTTEEVPESVD